MRTMLLTIGKDLTLAGTLSPVPVGTAASFTLTAIGGVAPYTITVQSEDFPAEWTITPNTDGTVDIVTADADTAGEFTAVFRVKDGDRDVRDIRRSVRVIALPLEIAGTLDNMEVGTPYSDTLAITGGVGNYAVTSATLPAGLGWSLAGGVGSPLTISGTPTGAAYSSPFTVVIEIIDEDGTTATFSQSITVGVDETVARRGLRSKVVGFWPLNNTLADAARIGLPFSGAASFTTGPGGVANDALATDATASAVITRKGMSAYHTSQSFAVYFFARATGSTSAGFRYVNSDGSVVIWSLNKAAVTGWEFMVNPAGTPETVTTGDTSTDWVFVVANVAAGVVDIYVDSQLVATDTVALGSLSATPDRFELSRATTEYSRVGYAHDALTISEIIYLHNGGDGRAYSDFGTVAYGTTPDAYALTLLTTGDGYWKFDETSGTNAADSVTGGIGALNGTNGAAMVTTIDPPPGFSAAGGVGSTDGGNDVFAGPNVDYSSGSLAYTDAIWVNPTSLTNFDIWTFLGTVNGSTANARASFFNQTSNAIPVHQYYSAAPALLAQAAGGPHPAIVTSTWAHVGVIFDTIVLLSVCDGLVRGGVAVSAQPTAVNLDEHFVGAQGDGTQTSHGRLSRRAYAKGHALTPTQLAKLYDLGNGSG